MPYREILKFEHGEIYNRRQDIHAVYGGQQQGGISTPKKYPAVFIFTGDSGEQHGYKDKFKPDGTYWYTGEGQRGDMKMLRGNRSIRDHQKEGKIIYLFESVDRGLVHFVGEASYLGHHHEERPDSEGNLRQAIVFELDVVSEGAVMDVELSTAPKPERSLKALWKLPIDELEARAKAKPGESIQPKERRVLTRQRSEAVKVFVQRRANGLCEACKKEAPFKTKENRPYLEPHHILRIADGGPDNPHWVAALCPNCHKQVHYGKDGDYMNGLLLDYLKQFWS